ncbi:MAG: hypothetical protein IJG37_04430, partial [Synergistaceae bacterium]|nr:hypothetical protein [Synergistaceae bacterium]MBQ6971250.1 hypothetical protein [Synergistaceae bacterium]
MLRKTCLLAESALAVIIAVCLIVSAMEIYTEGLARKTADPLAWIYTREAVSEKLAPVVPLFAVFAVLALAGWIAGVSADVKTRIGREFMTARTRRPNGILRAVILAAALCFIIAGVFNGSARDVFYKAVNICTECVGLG